LSTVLAAMSRFIIFAIDVEPDARKSIQGDRWEGVAITMRELAGLRCQLEETTRAPVHFNWFLRCDPQIERTWGRRDWVAEACPALLASLQQHGDLAGIHPHFWQWDDRRQIWFNDFTNSGWHAHCIGASIDGYRSVFGARPVASRCGDRWLCNDIVQLLRSEGIRYDLTLEPGLSSRPLFDDPYATAPLPDYRNAPRIPYRPSDQEFLLPERDCGSNVSDQAPLWIVPVTTTKRAYYIPQRQFPFVGKTCQTLNLVLRPLTVWKHVSAELDRCCREPLVFILRAGDLSQRRFLAAFRFVASRLSRHAGLPKCRFMRVDEAMDRFIEGCGQSA
jgi:hypothetical protein